MLDQEIAYFEEKKGEWLPIYGGKFALVKGRQVGVFDNMDEALAEAARRFGAVPHTQVCKRASDIDPDANHKKAA